MKDSKKLVIGILIGILISSTTIYAAYKYQAGEVGYTPSNSNFNVENVESAINELYEKTTGGPTYVAPGTSDTHKGIVYLDPTDLTKTCTAKNSTSTLGTKTGCMKWYIFDTTSSDYKLILGHNVTSNTAWSDDGKNVSYGASNVKKEVDTLVNETKWVLQPRLISGQEIANITSNKTWTSTGQNFYFDNNSTKQVANESNKSKYAWLFDNLSGSVSCLDYGCNVDLGEKKSYGYWTSTPYGNAGDGNLVWYVVLYGRYCVDLDISRNLWGIRPVITISKSIIK